MSIIKKIKMSVYSRSFKYLHKKEYINIRDLFKSEEMSQYHHPLVCLRYLAIQNYYGINKDGFKIYLSSGKYRLNNSELKKDQKAFVQLIKSFEKCGYNGSPIIMDVYGNIYNGTHRLALCIWTGIETIRICKGFKTEKKMSAKMTMDMMNIDETTKQRLVETYHVIRDKIINLS